jgi:AraC-like DNA-binding protein
MVFFQRSLAIKILKSKLYYLITIPVLVLGILILIYFSGIKDFPVFPNSQSFEYRFYTDSAAGGNSKILEQLINDGIIKLEYRIGNKINNPYAGLNIGPKENKSIHLRFYNELIIRLKGDDINGVGIALVTGNSLKRGEKNNQDVLFYQIFKITSGMNTHKLSMDKFEVPDWWGENNRIEDASSIKPDLKSLKAINVSSAYTPITGNPQSLEIYSMTFSRNNKTLITWVLMLEFACILIVFASFYLIERTRDRNQVITITYKPVENKLVEFTKSDFIHFINNNFQNCELTLDFVSEATGISQRRITNEIQNQFACNFKTYINRLRINESKRLLLESDLNIGEIAFKVGFNNQSHFNRVFKSEVLTSPTEYRDKHQA